MTNYYAGVGSRSTPPDVLEEMKAIARTYKSMGWILRSGGARGADAAFESEAGDAKEIYLPNVDEQVDKFTYDKAQRLAAMYHPAWAKMPEHIRKYHSRNVFQILGRDMETPSSLVVCWTKDSCISHYTRDLGTGGTGTAISVAFCRNLPIVNLARPDHRWCMQQFVAARNTGD